MNCQRPGLEDAQLEGYDERNKPIYAPQTNGQTNTELMTNRIYNTV